MYALTLLAQSFSCCERGQYTTDISKWVSLSPCGQFKSTWLLMLACLWIFVLSMRSAPLYSHHIAGTTCNAVSRHPVIFINWILFIIYESHEMYGITSHIIAH
ncbi:hypothetical protein PHLGIDRAFT_432527 [Phlebiopsis gigantea 11061_1 CR5-6]|uniref:Uncharacterized protein n=1 Tax=Phlebiopsis gigantea (strain 11061_1 CR5-6) TaxID=745531 RepID=A0A0C3RYB9_PHLG1|nr:hypothetical protein PHLGIDRAFT_432527 [Phlebiopsis gigantea 11061_1 CR5-6]